MRATEALHELGQSLWVDGITRDMLADGSLQRYIDRYSVTGLVPNPSSYAMAISSGVYDEAIQARVTLRPEELFFELAIEDLARVAGLFQPIHDRTHGADGWVSLEVSPSLAYDAAGTVQAARALHTRAGRRNLYITIPGTPEGLPAITELIAVGVPVHVTLLFSAAQYRAAADAYLTGIERRVADGADPVVGSVASVFVSRWDAAVAGQVLPGLEDWLGLACGLATYRAYRQVIGSDRVQRLSNCGARMQRLGWASTAAQDPKAPDTLYVQGLAAPFTVNTMPAATLEAFFDHGDVGRPLPADGGDADHMLRRFAQSGIDVDWLAERLQRDGVKAAADAWRDLLARIEKKAGRWLAKP